jgi:hypothetical protein
MWIITGRRGERKNILVMFRTLVHFGTLSSIFYVPVTGILLKHFKENIKTNIFFYISAQEKFKCT